MGRHPSRGDVPGDTRERTLYDFRNLVGGEYGELILFGFVRPTAVKDEFLAAVQEPHASNMVESFPAFTRFRKRQICSHLVEIEWHVAVGLDSRIENPFPRLLMESIYPFCPFEFRPRVDLSFPHVSHEGLGPNCHRCSLLKRGFPKLWTPQDFGDLESVWQDYPSGVFSELLATLRSLPLLAVDNAEKFE